jgi:hypothetical protein
MTGKSVAVARRRRFDWALQDRGLAVNVEHPPNVDRVAERRQQIAIFLKPTKPP